MLFAEPCKKNGDNIAVYPKGLVSSRQSVAPRDLALGRRGMKASVDFSQGKSNDNIAEFFVLWVNSYIIA